MERSNEQVCPICLIISVHKGVAVASQAVCISIAVAYYLLLLLQYLFRFENICAPRKSFSFCVMFFRAGIVMSTSLPKSTGNYEMNITPTQQDELMNASVSQRSFGAPFPVTPEIDAITRWGFGCSTTVSIPDLAPPTVTLTMPWPANTSSSTPLVPPAKKSKAAGGVAVGSSLAASPDLPHKNNWSISTATQNPLFPTPRLTPMTSSSSMAQPTTRKHSGKARQTNPLIRPTHLDFNRQTSSSATHEMIQIEGENMDEFGGPTDEDAALAAQAIEQGTLRCFTCWGRILYTCY